MKCKKCDEGMVMQVIPHIEHVTRDMAIDAGDISLEGAQIHLGDEQWVDVCECCEGNWQECAKCLDEYTTKALIEACDRD